VGLVYDSKELSEVTIARSKVAEVLQIQPGVIVGVCFIVRKIISKLKRAILMTTMYLIGVENTDKHIDILLS
jgi:hypothetical protein